MQEKLENGYIHKKPLGLNCTFWVIQSKIVHGSDLIFCNCEFFEQEEILSIPLL